MYTPGRMQIYKPKYQLWYYMRGGKGQENFHLVLKYKSIVLDLFLKTIIGITLDIQNETKKKKRANNDEYT